MDAVSPEFERETEVTLNKEFKLFDPRFTILDHKQEMFGGKKYVSQRALRRDKIPDLKFDAENNPAHLEKILAFTPFNPEEGYQLDERDMKKEERNKKIIDFDTRKYIGQRFANSYLTVESHGIDPNLHEALSLLRLQLFPPGLSFEGKPREDYLEKGAFIFTHFYPLDTGELPGRIKTNRYSLREGLILAVPSDLEKLEQIRARFVFAPKQKK